ncbi:ARID DNA-binding domain-containing protein [Tanacetum coccineum]
MGRNKERLKYLKNVHVKTDYDRRLKNSFKVEGTQHERKIIFSHGIREAMVETSETKIVIPCVLYTLEITLNVLCLDHLMALGFVVTYGNNKCQISYMFEQDKEGCDGETNCTTSKEGNGCDVETEKETVKCEKTKKVEGGCDHAKEENPQEHNRSSNYDTDVDQMADQEDGANTSETDDFMELKSDHGELQKATGNEFVAAQACTTVKGYLLMEGAAYTLPRSSQKKQLSHEYKEMLRQKINEIEAKRGHVFWKCPNKKNSTTLEAPTIDNQSKEPTMVRNELMAQGFVVTYGHNKCQISYMFEQDKEGYDGKTDCATSKEGNGCDVETEKDEEGCDGETDCATSKEGNGFDVETKSKIAKHNKYLEEYFDSIDSKDACPLIKGLEELKWDRNIVQDYLDEDYISVNGTLYAIKVNSFKRFISFLDLIKKDSIVFKNWEVLRKRFEDMIKWFYLIYLKQDVLEPLPPVIGNVKIDLLGLYKMVDSMGGYLSVSFRNRWKEVAIIHRLTKAYEEDLNACYKRTIDIVKFCYDTILRPWFKEEPMKCDKTKKVEGGGDHAKEENL